MKRTIKIIQSFKEIILLVEFEVPWIICWNFKYHKVYSKDAFISTVRDLNSNFGKNLILTKMQSQSNSKVFKQAIKVGYTHSFYSNMKSHLLYAHPTVQRNMQHSKNSCNGQSKKKATIKTFHYSNHAQVH